MRVTVMDRELHEPLTIVDVPISLVPDPVRNPTGGKFVSHRIMFALPPAVPFYATPITADDSPYVTQLRGRTTSITLEPVMRTTGTSPTNYKHEILFWYAYAEDPELALLLRAAFLPGQVSEMQMQAAEARIQGVFHGIGIGIEIGRRDL